MEKIRKATNRFMDGGHSYRYFQLLRSSVQQRRRQPIRVFHADAPAVPGEDDRPETSPAQDHLPEHVFCGYKALSRFWPERANQAVRRPAPSRCRYALRTPFLAEPELQLFHLHDVPIPSKHAPTAKAAPAIRVLARTNLPGHDRACLASPSQNSATSAWQNPVRLWTAAGENRNCRKPQSPGGLQSPHVREAASTSFSRNSDIPETIRAFVRTPQPKKV